MPLSIQKSNKDKGKEGDDGTIESSSNREKNNEHPQ
jgi:hypothetical protein